MLLEFRIKNFFSIGEEVTLSMLAGQEDQDNKELLHFNKYLVLPSCVIYGANGTGKTNILKAMRFLQHAVLTSYNNSPEFTFPPLTHKLLSNESTSFLVQFVTQNIHYVYNLEIKGGKVEAESLYYYPKTRATKIFERKGNKIIQGSKFKNEFLLVKDALKSNRLFLSCAANLSQNEFINNAYLYFVKEWILDSSSSQAWLDQSLNLLSNSEMKEKFSLFLKNLDIPIHDFTIEQKKFPIDEIEIPDFMRDLMKNVQADEFINTQVILDYGNFSIDLNDESSGIQKLFCVLCPIIDALEHGYLIYFDEFENGLHEFLVSKIVEYFNQYAHLHNAQLILNTHDTSLLSYKLFRRDQIWFTEMNPKTRSTDLYSMVELKGVRQNENFRNNYIAGKYGGIPMLASLCMSEDPQ